MEKCRHCGRKIIPKASISLENAWVHLESGLRKCEGFTTQTAKPSPANIEVEMPEQEWTDEARMIAALTKRLGGLVFISQEELDNTQSLVTKRLRGNTIRLEAK